MGQPVLDASGLMGQVVEVLPYAARVLLLTDVTHSIPVGQPQRPARHCGGNRQPDYLELRHVAETADIKAGDLLVSSGLGQRFPSGYPVAQVTEVVHGSGQPFAIVRAVPTAMLNRSRYLMLVFSDSRTPEERAAAAAEAQADADRKLPPKGPRRARRTASPAALPKAQPAAGAAPAAPARRRDNDQWASEQRLGHLVQSDARTVAQRRADARQCGNRPAVVAGPAIAFWSLTLPHRGGLGATFCFGLAQDVLAGTLFGQSALPLILIAFLVLSLQQRLRMFPCGSRAWCCWSCLASRSWSSSGSTR